LLLALGGLTLVVLESLLAARFALLGIKSLSPARMGCKSPAWAQILFRRACSRRQWTCCRCKVPDRLLLWHGFVPFRTIRV